MKLSYILLNVLLVGGGILIYDTLKGDPQSVSSGVGHYDPLRSDPVEEEDAGESRVVLLDGGGEGILAKRNANRLDELEGQLASLARRAREGGGSDGTAGGADVPPIALEAPEVLDGVASGFDEPTLKSIEQYVDEINRRKMVERQRNRVEGEVTRLGLELNEAQTAAVVDLTLGYQEKARDLLRQTFSRDDKGREDRKQAYEQLRQEYTTSLNRLVPATEAEKITASRLSRGLGFSAGAFGAQTGVTGTERGARRNRKDR